MQFVPDCTYMKTRIKLCLFVTDESDSAVRAIANLRAVCDDPQVRQNHDIDIDIVDINQSPQAAEDENILVTPTLLKKLPLPVRRLVGDLSDEKDIFVTLDIDPPARSERGTNGNSA